MADESPARGDEITDQYGRIRCMAVADKYVMCRRPHCIPFVLAVAEWHRRERIALMAEQDAMRKLLETQRDERETTA